MQNNILNLINLEAVNLLEEVEIREMQRRIFNIRKYAFELSNKEFIRLFRVNKRITRNIIDIVSEYINEPSRKSALDITTQVRKIIK